MAIRDNMTTISGLSAYRDAAFAISADGRTSGFRDAGVRQLLRRARRETSGGTFFPRARRPNRLDPSRRRDQRVLWERLYDRAPSAIGRTLLVNGAALEVIGVAPPSFMGVNTRSPAIWVPMAMGELTLRGPDGRPARAESAGPLWLEYVGRRRSGITLEQVRAEAGALRERLEATRSNPRARVSVLPVMLNNPSRQGPRSPGSWPSRCWCSRSPA